MGELGPGLNFVVRQKTFVCAADPNLERVDDQPTVHREPETTAQPSSGQPEPSGEETDNEDEISLLASSEDEENHPVNTAVDSSTKDPEKTPSAPPEVVTAFKTFADPTTDENNAEPAPETPPSQDPSQTTNTNLASSSAVLPTDSEVHSSAVADAPLVSPANFRLLLFLILRRTLRLLSQPRRLTPTL